MKQVVAYVTERFACRVLGACASTRQHRSTRRRRAFGIRASTSDSACAKSPDGIRYGIDDVQIMLRREGWAVSKNLVYRLYREEGFVLRGKRPRRRKMVVHHARCLPKRANEASSLDFIHDQLSNGEKFRALTVIDVFSREALAIEVGQQLRSEHVVEVLNRLVQPRGAPNIVLPIMARSSPAIPSIYRADLWRQDRVHRTRQPHGRTAIAKASTRSFATNC